MKKFIYISLALSIIFIASAEKTFACSCMVTNSPIEAQIKKAFTDSNAVFSGEVIEVKAKDENTISVKIRKHLIWKGEDMQEFVVTTSSESSMCGYNFQVGTKYLVYANRSADGFSTTNCSRTRIFDKNGDAKYLEKWSPDLKDTTPKVRLKNGVLVKSTIGGEAHESYVIRVRKGQTLKVQTSWKGDRDRNVRFFVTRAADFFSSDTTIRGTETYDGKNWQYKIKKTGNYYIYVTAYPTAEYTIKATVN